MNDAEMDKLLERAWADPGPREAFREQVLRDSVAALARRQRRRAQWRVAGLSVAAALIAGVSFLLGRCSLPLKETGAPPVATPAAPAGRTVAVPDELVAWLEAARFFKQLEMPERVALAYERASALLPQDTAIAGGATGVVWAVAGEETERPKAPAGPAGMASWPRSVENISRMMAQSLGD
jgi:hypothetical protein